MDPAINKIEILKNGVTESRLIANMVLGNYNSTEDEFYAAEQPPSRLDTYKLPNIIFLDVATNNLYRYIKDSSPKFVKIGGGSDIPNGDNVQFPIGE